MAYKQQTLLTGVHAGKPMGKASADSFLPGSWVDFVSLCPKMAGDKKLSGISFIRELSYPRGLHPQHLFIGFPKNPSSDAIA